TDHASTGKARDGKSEKRGECITMVVALLLLADVGADEGRRHDIAQRPLCGGAVVFVAIDQHRRERLVSAERANLIDAESGFLAVLDRGRDGRMTQRMTPHVQADPLAEFADDAQDRARAEPAVSALAAVAT